MGHSMLCETDSELVRVVFQEDVWTGSNEVLFVAFERNPESIREKLIGFCEIWLIF